VWGWILAASVILAGFFIMPALLALLPRTERGGAGGGLGPSHVEAARRQLTAERTNDEPKDD
jgi:hypothetical protein